jgi:predicted nucleotidyltransferase
MVAPSDPGNILFGRTRQAILALTFLRPDESFYLREIVRRTGCGAGAVQRELKLLTEAGILRRDRHRFFQANSLSAIFEPLKQIVVRTVGLGERLRAALTPVSDRIRLAFIFGSFARGEQHAGSDIDLMIVSNDNGPSLEEAVTLLRVEQAAIGREINPFVMPAVEWRGKLRAGNPFVARVAREEKTFLIGAEDELKRLGEERMAQAPPAEATGSGRPARSGRPRHAKRKGNRAR